AEVVPADDAADLLAAAERVLAGADGNYRVSVADVLGEAGDWPTCRRLLAEMTAIHHHPGLNYVLTWSDGMRLDPMRCPSWLTEGWFARAGEPRAGEPRMGQPRTGQPRTGQPRTEEH
ncbi:MAG: hypothetical protein ACRDNF_01595, partial [Streptosporangiaceae bacterium]